MLILFPSLIQFDLDEEACVLYPTETRRMRAAFEPT